MSNVKILEFGFNLDWGNLAFPTLRDHLEKHLETVRSLTDLEHLLARLNPLLKDQRYNEDEQAVLKRLRQRAYDLKRKPKFKTGLSAPNPALKPRLAIQSIKDHTKEEIIMEPMTAGAKTESFTEGMLRAIAGLSGERFIKSAPALIAWLSSALLVSYFLWQQSVELYESAGFTDSAWASAGGIFMIVGFAAYHSITRSKLALLLCLYASGYEAYLMISGTVENEHQIQIQNIQINPDLVFQKEKAAKSLAHYHELKQRYDNPESKVFKNDWFLKTHLNPAWQESLADHKELVAKESALTATLKSGHITWLKILYRLGLVFLCMMLVHRFFAVWAGRESAKHGA